MKALQDENIPLYVTTSKHEPVALQMCQDLGIAKYFKGIYGSNSDRIHKADVIRYALSINDLPKEETVIIGDTKFDLIGGQAVGIKPWPSLRGFGDLEDLLLYSPDFICHSPLDILETLKNRFTNCKPIFNNPKLINLVSYMHCMQPGFDHQLLQLNPNLALFGTSHWHQKHLLHLLDHLIHGQ